MYAALKQSMNEIIPAILPNTYEELEVGLARLVDGPRYVQIDVCDGVFVPARTWPLNPSDRGHFSDIIKGEIGLPHWEDFNFEVDLMVHNPEKHVLQWVAAGMFRVVFHLESKHNWVEFKDAVGETAEIGLAIDLDPPYEKLAQYIPRVDYVQIMGIAKLGKQGTELDDRVFALIDKVRADFPDVTIQIDGGVTEKNAKALLDRGADRLVVGSAIGRDVFPLEAYRRFTEL